MQPQNLVVDLPGRGIWATDKIIVDERVGSAAKSVVRSITEYQKHATVPENALRLARLYAKLPTNENVASWTFRRVSLSKNPTIREMPSTDEPAGKADKTATIDLGATAARGLTEFCRVGRYTEVTLSGLLLEHRPSGDNPGCWPTSRY